MSLGTVSLVGAGPFEVEFLTLAAIEALQNADVILYDALLSSGVMRYFAQRANCIFVGKRCGKHAMRQEEINSLLVTFAAQGKQVVRLKGGDPLIFGRAAEEIAALTAHGISYRIIPGISALNGIAAKIGLPLTSRDHSNEFRALQGHHLSDDPVFWQDLARYRGTIAFFMAHAQLSKSLSALKAAGADPDLPLALAESLPTGGIALSLGHLAAYLEQPIRKSANGPVIVYLGQNVRLIPANKPAELCAERLERARLNPERRPAHALPLTYLS